MALFTGIGDFFRGAFGEDAEEKKRRKQREAQEAANRKKQAQPVRTQQTQQRPTQSSTLNEGLAPKPTQPKPQVTPLQQTQAPVVAAPRVQAPKPQPTPVVKQAVPQPDYKTLGAVKDIGDYYGSDLRLLEQEVAKGDKADQKRIEGLKQSLQNRKKELTEYQASKPKMTNASLTGIPEDETKQFVAYTKQQRQKAAQLKQDQTKPIEVSAGNGNKAKFTVAQYASYLTKQPKEMQTQILKGLTQQAEKDQGSRDILEGLNRNGVLDGDLKDFYQGFIDKSGGGLLRAGQRLAATMDRTVDKVLPGHNTFNLSTRADNLDKAADELDENYRNTLGAYTRSGKGGESLGSVTKGGIETAATIASGNAAGAGTKALPWIERLGEGGKIAQFFARNIPKVADDLVSGTAEMAQDRGRGNKVNPVESLLVGTGVNRTFDAAMPVFRNLFGRKVAGVVEDNLDDVERGIAERSANVDDLARQQNEKEVEELQRWNQENIDRQLRGEEPLPRPGEIPEEAPEAPAYAKQGQELPSTTKAVDELNEVNDSLRRLKEASLRKQLADAIREYPQYKDELIRGFSTAKFADNFEGVAGSERLVARKAELENLIRQSDELAANSQKAVAEQAAKTADDIAEQQAVNAAVKEAQTPTPGQVVQGEPAPTSPEIEANDAYQVESVNPNGSKSGENYTVEYPSEAKIQEYRTKKELANANNSGYASSKSDIIVKDADGNEVRRIPYDEAVQRFGTTDREELSHRLANGYAPRGNVSRVETNGSSYDNFNKEAGIDSGVENLDYLTAQQRLEKLAGNKTLEDLSGKQGFRIPTAINSNTQGAVADAVTNVTGDVTGAALKSQNPLANFFGQTLFGFNKKSTLNNAEKTLVEQVAGRRGGQGKLIDQVVENIETPLKGLTEEAQAMAKEKVYKAFELYNNGQTYDALQVIKSFSQEERAYFDATRELNSLRNNLNRTTMSADKIDEYANGMHMPRIFDLSEDDVVSYATSQNRVLDLNPAKRRKQLEELSAELQEKMLRDPAQASAIRTDVALHNKAISDYSASVGALPGAVSDVEQRGFLQIPEQARYGDLAGKWVRRDLGEPMLSGDLKYKSDTYRAVNTLLNKYQSSIMGKMEQGLRKGLTVYNPATRMGNRGANLAQGSMAGFNLPEMAVQQQHFINVLRNGGDEWTRLAKTFGALDNGDALLKFSGGVNDPQGLFKDFRKGLNDSYQNVDNAAKVSMFKWQIQRGATPEEAARFVNRALPNIGNSGEVYSFFSRLPVLGTPFRAIQPEVLRALSSTMGRNTVPFLVAMATYTTLQNATWKDVPPEERAQIQERFGSGQTPFKGINDFFGSKGIPTDKVLPSSWSFNAAGVPGLENLFAKDPETGNRPVVDVDPRRLMGMYSINLGSDSAADSVVDTALKASPMNIPAAYNNGEWTFQPQNVVASRLFSPLWQAAIDKDFRGKSVQSPERDGVNVVDPVTGQPLDQRDNPGRAAQYLLRSYIPQVNDVANVVDASQGKENFYGQTMNLPQSVARLFGLKGESFDSARIQDMNDTKAYFDDKAVIDKQLEGMTPNEQTAWKRLTGYDKLNEKKPNAFGGESWVKAPVYNFGEDKWKDYAANPRLYDLMVQKKQSDSARDGSPVQPEFDARLSDGFRKQLLQNKMVAPGDDAELDQRMYASPEWDYYQNLKEEYKAKAKEYYPQSDDNDEFTDELVRNQDVKFPTKPDVLKAYSAAYKNYYDGKGEKPKFNDQIKAAKEAYNKETLNWTNEARARRGLPAITWDVWNNPTFGFDETPSGSGFGFGFGGGGGGNAANYVNTLTDLTNFGDSVKRYAPVEAQAMPNEVAIFQKLMAGSGGGRSKPKLGAASSGRG